MNGPHFVERQHLRQWFSEARTLSELSLSIGKQSASSEYLEDEIGLPFHLRFVIDKRMQETGEEVGREALNSIPFYSLCNGLFLPLSGMQPEKVRHLFGIDSPSPPTHQAREQLLASFLVKDVGLDLVSKLGAVLGDPFRGRPSTFKRDSLLRLLLSVQMVQRRTLLDRLTMVGDVAVLFAESRNVLKVEPQLTAQEVFETLRYMREEPRTRKFDILRSLLVRCGRLEAFFLAKLLLRNAGFGFDYQGPLIARSLAEHFGAPPEEVAHAMALTDPFKVAQILSEEGAAGLKQIQLQPLVPLRPALAGGNSDDVDVFPTWVERKYDGIRLMLHKSTDNRGSTLCGAYTRRKGDWLESVPGLDLVIKQLPCQNCIIDGEIYGTVMDFERGSRPASVYDVYASLRGEKTTGVNLKYAAFDLIFLDGRDLTGMPLSERRRMLQMLLAPLGLMPHLPVPVSLSEGQLAQSADDVKRLYHHFRNQGYEGIITKRLDGPYKIASRDPEWTKKKPAITLDLVLLAAVFSVTTKQNAGMFGSYVIGARLADGTFEDVGDVAGVDRIRDGEIQNEIMREGLLTGGRVERASASGVRPGVEFRPHLVVTVRFEGIIREQGEGGQLRLRDPKLVMIRSDKGPHETDKVEAIEELYLRQRVG
ncbi:MAG: hypothetical protein GY822_18035 [Deltaproteobacteria bacterium]|nr:hypothetical protein [Deltaproteobacteria bacterium]